MGSDRESGMIVALFDSDGTLYSNQMGRGMMKYAEMHGRRGLGRLYFASLVLPLLFDKLKLAKPDAFQRVLIERLGWLIKGYDAAQGAQAFQWVAREYLLATRRTDVIQRLRHHQAQGQLVLIVSGGFEPCLELIGEELGVANLIGTQIEVKDGRYTGRILPPVIKGQDKVSKTREFLSSRGYEVDWNASYAYGDSFTDQDLLKLVGHPVAVYPDQKLHELARSRKWEVLGTPK
jgi:HAD superfamily hydrolase (TIGR01490 family)